MTISEKIKTAELTNFMPQKSSKYYRNLNNMTDIAKKEGWEEEYKEEWKKAYKEAWEKGYKQGQAEVKESVIRIGLKEGLSISLLSKLTGVTKNIIQQIQHKEP